MNGPALCAWKIEDDPVHRSTRRVIVVPGQGRADGRSDACRPVWLSKRRLVRLGSTWHVDLDSGSRGTGPWNREWRRLPREDTPKVKPASSFRRGRYRKSPHWNHRSRETASKAAASRRPICERERPESVEAAGRSDHACRSSAGPCGVVRSNPVRKELQHPQPAVADPWGDERAADRGGAPWRRVAVVKVPPCVGVFPARCCHDRARRHDRTRARGHDVRCNHRCGIWRLSSASLHRRSTVFADWK